ncbi:MAG: carbohydrate ABC transporter permease [Candidatus Omnitrophica bacterium]|nr:carbohydrate ABC transporter permease [Candidatus Omnitrophota bacterium]
MKRPDIINSAVVLLLTVLVVTTLAPLFLMLHTSLKPAGTLTKKIKEITLASGKEIEGALSVKLRQDIRRFSAVSLFVRGGGFEIILSDIQGRTTSVKSDKYAGTQAKNGLRNITIPVSDFNIRALNLGLPEKVVESVIIRLEDKKTVLFIDSLSLKAKRATLANYKDVLTSGHFKRYFFNSFLIALIITIGNIFFSTVVGYAFARKEFPFKKTMFLLILASIMIPPQVLIVPVFIMMKGIRWLNTYWALIVPSLVQPFGIFLMRQYISRLPVSLEDQARVDGATERQILFRIVFPLSRPALAIIGINTFMGAWNTFLFPFILTNTPQMRTLPVGLALFKNLQGGDWVHLMAGSSITALPVILVFLMFQKHIIAGLTTGLVKR